MVLAATRKLITMACLRIYIPVDVSLTASISLTAAFVDGNLVWPGMGGVGVGVCVCVGGCVCVCVCV